MEKFKESEIEAASDLLYEIIRYLQDWVCSKDGFYRPIAIQDIESAFLTNLKNNNWKISDAIESFKEHVNTGKQEFKDDPVLCTPKVKSLYPELYKRHSESVKKFEKKYNVIFNK